MEAGDQSFSISGSGNNEVFKAESNEKSEEKMAREDQTFQWIHFDPESNMSFSKWVKYFEETCIEYNKDDTWKLRKISSLLKGKALTAYVNQCLGINTWKEIKETLQEIFMDLDLTSFSEFTNLRFRQGSDLKDYFLKKVEIGKKLNLEREIIIEGLTEGLNPQIRQIIAANTPKTTTEWLNLANKLIKITNTDRDSRNSKTWVTPRFNPQFRQWRPNFANGRNHPGVQNRFPNNGHPSNMRPVFRPANQTTHHQRMEQLPPRPCRICQNYGIKNAFHWEQTCSISANINLNPHPIIQQKPEEDSLGNEVTQ